MLIYFGNCLRGSFGIRIVIFKVVNVSIFIFFFFGVYYMKLERLIG